MRRSKAYILLCVSAATVFAASAVGTTLASWRISSGSTHVAQTAAVSGRIVEEYEPVTNVHPGSTVERLVNIENTGSVDSVIRVKVDKAWGAERNEAGMLIPDDTVSPDNILIDYNEDYWQYDEKDGYFYYRAALEPGEVTAEPLFEEYTIDPATGPEFMGMEAEILVKMECVQAAFGGPSVWGKTCEELGFTYEAPEKPEMVTKAEFVNPEDGFAFSPTDAGNHTVSVQDLFYNFKDLLPGETVSQTITVGNRYSKAVEIHLRAEDIEQSLSPEQTEQVNRLLREYATITVADKDGKTLYSGPIWGNLTGEGSTMKADIPLGEFAPEESKALTVTLQLAPEMGNEYQELFGLVRWVWSAAGIDTPVDPPQTGDASQVVLFASLMAVSGVGLLFLLLTGRKKKDEEAGRPAD